MLLRGANAVGYTTYPDNVVREFVKEAHLRGIDLFRIFDSLNWADQMQVAIDATREAGAIAKSPSTTRATSSSPAASDTRSTTTSIWRRISSTVARTSCASRTWPACSSPTRPRSSSRRSATRSSPDPPPSHDSAGIQGAAYLQADKRESTRSTVPSVHLKFDSQPNLERRRDARPIAAPVGARARQAAALRLLLGGPFDLPGLRQGPFHGSAEVYEHEIPDGQYTIFGRRPARTRRALARRHEDVRRGQRTLRRRREGDAVVEDRRRRASCSRTASRRRTSWIAAAT